MRYLYLLFSLFLCVGCQQKEELFLNVDIFPIDYLHSEKKSFSDIPNTIMGEPRYVLVKENSKDLMCQHVNKVKQAHGKFFIMDVLLKKLLVCDIYGNVFAQIGIRGNGPDEYLSIIDFDVDSKGNVYCIDGQLDKLFVYNPDFSIKKVRDLPFDADAIQVMEDGNILFGLSSWNKQEGKGYKLSLTDKDLNIQSSFLPYDEYKDDNYWISMHTFIQHNGNVTYNQPIDNNVYVFQANNQVELRSYYLDFGKRNVPNEHKKHIERNLDAFNSYTLLKSPVVVTSNYIAGTLLDGRKTRFFIYDIKQAIRYEGEGTDEYDDSALVGYCEPDIISVIEPMVELPVDCAYPDSVKNHLLNEGRVIVLRELKE